LAKYGVRKCDNENAYRRARRANDPEYAKRDRTRCREYYAKKRAKQKALAVKEN
jgi:hypothetical protein